MAADFAKVIIRRLRLIRIDRNFLVYLVFIAIASIFWLLETMKEDVTMSMEYKIRIVDAPANVIFTSEIPDEVKVNFSGHGQNVIQHLIKNEEHTLEINFHEVSQAGGKILIDASTFQRAVAKKLPKGLKYLSTTPVKIEADYSTGERKRVPIIFACKVNTRESRMLSNVIFSPDSVEICAPPHLFQAITSISTEHRVFDEVDDTISCRLALDIPKGAKAFRDSVSTKICVDLFTDKTISVPIYSENTPRDKIIRPFPLQAKITFLVSSSLYNEISPADFLIVVDYNTIKPGDTRCKLILRQMPDGVSNIRISPETVEYVIEQETE